MSACINMEINMYICINVDFLIKYFILTNYAVINYEMLFNPDQGECFSLSQN